MGHRLLSIIKHYKLWISGIIGVVLIVISNSIMAQICNPINNSILFEIRDVIKMILILFTIIVTGGSAIILTLTVRYNDKTNGRNFLKDAKKYNRSYKELLEYYEAADPYRVRDDELPIANWHNQEGIILGKKGDRLIHIPSLKKDGSGAEGRNVCLFGHPGTGKTSCQIIPTALNFGGSVLAADIKGDIYNATKDVRNVKLFAPDNPSISCHYNLMDGVDKLSVTERKLFLERRSIMLLSDDPNDRYFSPGGRDFFVGIALYLLKKNNRTTFSEIARAVVHGNAIKWVEEIRSSDCIEAREYTDHFFGTNEKNVAGAYGTIVKALRPFVSDEMADLLTDTGDENTITPETLEHGYDIYIEIPQHMITVYAPITTIIFANFMDYFSRRPDITSCQKTRPILLMLDEFPQWSFDRQILNSLATLRSKCVFIFLAQQSIGQLNERYGDNGARQILDTCSYLSVMSAQDPGSRDYFKNFFGSKKVLRVSSSGNDHQSSEDREPIFQPETFGNLGNNVVIYMNGKYVVAEKTFWKD